MAIGVSCDIRHRLSGLAFHRDAIGLEGYVGVVVGNDLTVLCQHVDNLRFKTVDGGGCDVGCDDRVGTGTGARPIPVMDERLHRDVAPIVIMISSTGGVVFLVPDPVTDACV